ncbi:hypothetical protein Hanom_Chr11g01007971 [Helianthus anomalus]
MELFFGIKTLCFNNKSVLTCLTRHYQYSACLRSKSRGLDNRLDFRTRPIWSIISIRPNILCDHSYIGNNLLRLYLMVTLFG